MEKKEFNFKKAYEKISKEYDLPEFKKLSEDFDIEKIQDKESKFLIREIRRAINEKMSAYLHLFETLINPTSPPIFIFSALRNLSEEKKEEIKSTYKELSKIQIQVMKLDTVYSEKSEVKFINSSFKNWQTLKTKIFKIIEKLEENIEKDDTSKERGYFG